jgi:hypothetical protein
VKSPLSRDAFESVDTPILELEAGSSNKVLDGARDEDLAWSRRFGHPGANMNSNSDDSVVHELALTEMHAGADDDLKRPKGHDDRNRRANRITRGLKDCEEPVSRCVDFPTSEPFDL